MSDRRTLIGLTKPGGELIADASILGVFHDIPREIGTNYREYLGRFAAPGIRALVYVVVDGEPWPMNSMLADYITYRTADSDGRVDVRPFGEPAAVYWRPDAGETDASVSLDLAPVEPDGREYLAIQTGLGRGEDVPHIVIGWHEVPDR